MWPLRMRNRKRRPLYCNKRNTRCRRKNSRNRGTRKKNDRRGRWRWNSLPKTLTKKLSRCVHHNEDSGNLRDKTGQWPGEARVWPPQSSRDTLPTPTIIGSPVPRHPAPLGGNPSSADESLLLGVLHAIWTCSSTLWKMGERLMTHHGRKHSGIFRTMMSPWHD